MARGDGSISKMKTGKYRVSVVVGRKLDGRPIRATKVATTLAEARKVRDQFVRERDYGLVPNGGKTTFEEHANEWHLKRVASGKFARAYLDREEQMIRLMNGYIGQYELKEISARLIEDLYATIKQDKVKERGTYSNTTMHMVHVKLRQIMQKAVDYDLIFKNPCNAVDAPMPDVSPRKALSEDELKRLYKCLEDEELQAKRELGLREARRDCRKAASQRTMLFGLNVVSYALAAKIASVTGARRGEVFALCWESVDFKRGELDIHQSLTERGEVKPPKTLNGYRRLSIGKGLTSELEDWKGQQAIELAKIGVVQDKATPICCSCTGGFIELHNFTRWWQRFRTAHGFADVKLHELRHTQATQLIANGVDPKTVQTRLGHADGSRVTLDTYVHARIENERVCGSYADELFYGGQKEPCFRVVKKPA
ncbi:tyrosine-type recombinase/integrase [Gordonibacter urolithinfaciens]|uniref:tyrosine-type recombinase/integrase n=1 Tax=Gordonibacter urolithinfaciens TaxID=1335613 RepID=UPI003AAD5880